MNEYLQLGRNEKGEYFVLTRSVKEEVWEAAPDVLLEIAETGPAPATKKQLVALRENTAETGWRSILTDTLEYLEEIQLIRQTIRGYVLFKR